MHIDAVPDFGNLVSLRRRELGLTQEQLAERADMSVRGISDLERGARRSPHQHTLLRLLGALNVPPDDHRTYKLAAQKHGRTSSRQAHRAPVVVPAPSSKFIGRKSETAAILALVRRPEVRLLTLTGVAGVGKTRLAIQVAADLAAEFPDGIAFVPLASVSDPDLVASATMKALGIREVAGRSLPETLIDRTMLLVFDNFEHVLPAAALVATLLSDAPHIKVLITSRAPLNIAREQRFPVLPFSLPDPNRLPDHAELARYDAVQFFADRALAVNPEFELTPLAAVSIARIAGRLDGLPLALELAAARSIILSPAAILGRLDHRLSLLTTGPRDAPDRHRSLRHAISWSYDLLEPESRRLFRVLSLFAGGFTLELAARIWTGGVEAGDELEMLDQLAALVDRSLVTRKDTETGEPRFSMLPTLREYGAEQLELNGEAGSARQALAVTVACLTAEAEPRLTGPGQLTWFNRLEDEHDNIRQALTWSLTHAPSRALEMSGNLIRFWDHHSHLREGQRWLTSALEANPDAAGSCRARAHWGIGTLALVAGDYHEAERALNISLAEANACQDDYHAGFALNGLGSAFHLLGDHHRAMAVHEQGLTRMRTVGDADGIAALLGNLAYGAFLLHEHDRALARCRESIQVYRDIASDHGAASMLGTLGRVLLAQGKVDEAAEALREALELSWTIGNRWYIAVCLQSFAGVAAIAGEPARAVQLFSGVTKLCQFSHVVLPPTDIATNERFLSMARADLDGQAFATAWESGQTLSLAEIIATVLNSDSSEGQDMTDDGNPCPAPGEMVSTAGQAPQR